VEPFEVDRRRRRRHWEMLAVASFVVVMSLVLQVRHDGHVAPGGLAWLRLPPLCLSRSMFGVQCPGCGLTRSFIHLAHGDWRQSIATHRVGWLLALAVLAQFPYRIAGLCFAHRELIGRPVREGFGYFLIAALVGNWLFNVWTGADWLIKGSRSVSLAEG